MVYENKREAEKSTSDIRQTNEQNLVRFVTPTSSEPDTLQLPYK